MLTHERSHHQPALAGPHHARDWSWRSAAITIVVGYVALAAALVVVGLVLVHLLAPVRHWDDHVNSWFAAHRHPRWDRLSKDGTFVANTLGVVVVAAVVSLFGLLRRWGRTAALLLVGLAVELSVFLTVNYTVARPRPAAPHLGSTPSTYSFPSGHVAATFVLYGGIAVLVAARTRHPLARAAAWLLAAVFVTWVAFSRVYEAQHHPTDVMAGLAMGIGALIIAVLAVRPAGPRASTRPEDSSPEEVVR